MAIFNFARCTCKLRYYGDVIHSCYRPIACDVITRARDGIRHVGVTGPVIALVLCYENDKETMVICAIPGCYKNSKRAQGINFIACRKL